MIGTKSGHPIPTRERGDRCIYPRLAADETIPRPQTNFERRENTRVQLGNAKGVWYNEADKSEVREAHIMNMKTDRMIIRDFTMNDINDMQAILGDAETMKNCEPAYTIEKTAAFLQKFCIEKRGAVAAVHKDTAKVIGYILFHELDDGVYEIGWFFNRAFWGQGLAYESCKAVIDYAFDKMNAHKVFAETIDGMRSVHLMKKLGMKAEGIQRSQTKDSSGSWADVYLYGLLSEDRQ